MSKRNKIAIYSGVSTSTTFIERLISGLAQKKMIVYVFGLDNGRNQSSENIIYKTYSGRLSKLFVLLKYSILLLIFKPKNKRQLDVLLKQKHYNTLYYKVKFYPVLYYKPDVFHLQWAKGIDDWMWVKAFGMKLVVSLRGAHINYSPLADKTLASIYNTYFPNVDAFHAVCEAISLEAQKYGAIRDNIKVVYSGVNLETFPEQPKTKNKVFKILSVGRPHWKKGYVYALDAFKLLKNHGLMFHYTIVGGKNNIELAYQIKDLELEQYVTLAKQLAFEDVVDQIQSSDLLLLPSLEEGIANVVLEAMALKTLVVSTYCGGMKEVITNEYNGFLVPIRDSEAIVMAIEKVMTLSDNEKETILNNAFETINNNHSETLMVDRMLDLYTTLF
ncbi:glycosyltransferase family 4 protein [Gaetbulibacter sp. M235]|uniref:glycosyltransferase family 4 protein n=1 Tax=Gaetbulibacter sp. M235 TaxID=3126510 RepID=UPI00374F7834